MLSTRVLFGTVFAVLMACLGRDSHATEPRHITIAAAADLRFALDAVIADYHQAHPQDAIEVTYGSSGKLLTQIEQGAPFELFFSADSDYPNALVAADTAGGKPVPYAMGSIVLWSASVDASKLTLADLTKPEFDHIAIANPQHAPYGKRAEQALRAAGVWDAVQSKLTYGDNIAQTAQFVASGNAKIGIIARSLALDPQLAAKGKYAVIPTSLYAPLVQSFVLTKRGANNALATDFVQYVQSAPARDVLHRYGFSLPDAPASH